MSRKKKGARKRSDRSSTDSSTAAPSVSSFVSIEEAGSCDPRDAPISNGFPAVEKARGFGSGLNSADDRRGSGSGRHLGRGGRGGSTHSSYKNDHGASRRSDMLGKAERRDSSGSIGKRQQRHSVSSPMRRDRFVDPVGKPPPEAIEPSIARADVPLILYHPFRPRERNFFKTEGFQILRSQFHATKVYFPPHNPNKLQSMFVEFKTPAGAEHAHKTLNNSAFGGSPGFVLLYAKREAFFGNCEVIDLSNWGPRNADNSERSLNSRQPQQNAAPFQQVPPPLPASPASDAPIVAATTPHHGEFTLFSSIGNDERGQLKAGISRLRDYGATKVFLRESRNKPVISCFILFPTESEAMTAILKLHGRPLGSLRRFYLHVANHQDMRIVADDEVIILADPPSHQAHSSSSVVENQEVWNAPSHHEEDSVPSQEDQKGGASAISSSTTAAPPVSRGRGRARDNRSRDNTPVDCNSTTRREVAGRGRGSYRSQREQPVGRPPRADSARIAGISNVTSPKPASNAVLSARTGSRDGAGDAANPNMLKSAPRRRSSGGSSVGAYPLLATPTTERRSAGFDRMDSSESMMSHRRGSAGSSVSANSPWNSGDIRRSGRRGSGGRSGSLNNAAPPLPSHQEFTDTDYRSSQLGAESEFSLPPPFQQSPVRPSPGNLDSHVIPTSRVPDVDPNASQLAYPPQSISAFGSDKNEVVERSNGVFPPVPLAEIEAATLSVSPPPPPLPPQAQQPPAYDARMGLDFTPPQAPPSSDLNFAAPSSHRTIGIAPSVVDPVPPATASPLYRYPHPSHDQRQIPDTPPPVAPPLSSLPPYTQYQVLPPSGSTGFVPQQPVLNVPGAPIPYTPMGMQHPQMPGSFQKLTLQEHLSERGASLSQQHVAVPYLPQNVASSSALPMRNPTLPLPPTSISSAPPVVPASSSTAALPTNQNPSGLGSLSAGIAKLSCLTTADGLPQSVQPTAVPSFATKRQALISPGGTITEFPWLTEAQIRDTHTPPGLPSRPVKNEAAPAPAPTPSVSSSNQPPAPAAGPPAPAAGPPASLDTVPPTATTSSAAADTPAGEPCDAASGSKKKLVADTFSCADIRVRQGVAKYHDTHEEEQMSPPKSDSEHNMSHNRVAALKTRERTESAASTSSQPSWAEMMEEDELESSLPSSPGKASSQPRESDQMAEAPSDRAAVSHEARASSHPPSAASASFSGTTADDSSLEQKSRTAETMKTSFMGINAFYRDAAWDESAEYSSATAAAPLPVPVPTSSSQRPAAPSATSQSFSANLPSSSHDETFDNPHFLGTRGGRRYVPEHDRKSLERNDPRSSQHQPPRLQHSGGRGSHTQQGFTPPENQSIAGRPFDNGNYHLGQSNAEHGAPHTGFHQRRPGFTTLGQSRGGVKSAWGTRSNHPAPPPVQHQQHHAPPQPPFPDDDVAREREETKCKVFNGEFPSLPEGGSYAQLKSSQSASAIAPPTTSRAEKLREALRRQPSPQVLPLPQSASKSRFHSLRSNEPNPGNSFGNTPSGFAPPITGFSAGVSSTATPPRPAPGSYVFTTPPQDTPPHGTSAAFTDDVSPDKVAKMEAFKARFDGLPKFIDSHTHIDFILTRTKFRSSWPAYQQYIRPSMPDSYGGCIAVFCNPNTWRTQQWRAIISGSPDVWGAIGCHPKSALDFNIQSDLPIVEAAMQHKRMVAVGEVGLDYSGDFYSSREKQIGVFEAHVALALRINKPIVIHSRDSDSDAFGVLDQMIGDRRDITIHRHCFTGDWATAKKWLLRFPSLYMGLTPLICSNNDRGYGPREVARHIPLEKLLLETDAPYFVPSELRSVYDFSHPGLAIAVAEVVADLRGIPIDDVIHQTRQNTIEMYGLERFFDGSR